MAGVDINTLSMEQYLALSRGNQASGMVKPEIRGNVNFKIKSQFMRELREYTFSENKNEDAYDHIDRAIHGGIIAKIDTDEDVILEEVDAEEDAKVVEKNVDVQGRPKESQAKVRVENLEQDKIAQALEITKLKQRIRRLEKMNKEDASKQGGKIAELDADEDVILEDVAAELKKDVEVPKDAAAGEARKVSSTCLSYRLRTCR
uniref:Uncharacterized protein n=1 Tax=Tanacetum cinerariifolium TaxID=118510 RepID=A0A6L2NZN7_TANCI|nr:hypothetical protein [Tanacetum cinerariifolium]